MPSSGEMTCRDLVETVTEYLEGTLPGEARLRFEAHLAECPPCLEYLDQMRHTIGAMGRLPKDVVSQETARRLLNMFRTWKKRLPS